MVHILIVEPESSVAASLCRDVVAGGMAADVAVDGEHAARLAGSTRYDVVVLSATMPGVDGFAACRRLRAQDPGLPMLLLTRYESSGDRVRGLDMGADDCLSLPFSPPEFMARLRALTRRRWRS